MIPKAIPKSRAILVYRALDGNLKTELTKAVVAEEGNTEESSHEHACVPNVTD
jgi:hypothetical protein